MTIQGFLNLFFLMQVNGAVVSLNRTVQNFFGVGIYEDETGVTAEQTIPQYIVSVFFDGTTAQIYMEGRGEEHG